MSRYPILQKKVYPIRDLDPLLKGYLEKWSRSRLTKLINVPISGGSLASTYITPPFYRWRLEGIHNIHYSNNTGNKLSLLHSAFRLPLQEFFPDSLIHVSTEGGDTLILDFNRKDAVFDRIDPEAYATYKDLDPSTFRSREEKLIRIPYIGYLY